MAWDKRKRESNSFRLWRGKGVRNITTMDDEFQAFLEEVEQLSIKHGRGSESKKNEGEKSAAPKAMDGTTADADADDNGEGEDHLSFDDHINTNKRVPGKKSAGKEKKNAMIANANNNQKSWSEFKQADLSSISGDINGEGASCKVSFQIKSTKDKKKKKKKGKATAKTVDEQKPQPPVEEKKGIQQAAKGTAPAGTNSIDEFTNNECPRWTLVIDTCCLLHDNGMGVQQLIDMANHAANAQYRKNNTNTSSMASMIYEPIHIVIPFKVHSELEYQSKKQSQVLEDGKILAYAARMAIRMLRDELEQSITSARSASSGTMMQGHRHQARGNTTLCNTVNVVHSQSLLESRKAADEFLPNDKTSSNTNDDHILACALMEQSKKFQQQGTAAADSYSNNPILSTSTAAGGVVVVTIDNNLACKCYANELKVYSPTEFRQYYQTRMESLRQRAMRSLAAGST